MAERVGLLGWPVEHSLSPAMHNAAFAALGLDWRYDLLPVPPDQLEGRIAELITDGYRGFNVTVPHKRAVLALPQIAERDTDVQASGAANTLIVLPDGGLRATNTDWRGFADDLAAHEIVVRNAPCLILGTGGAAQAVAYALRRAGAGAIWFASRKTDADQSVIPYADLGRFVRERDASSALIVNCTPVGLYPDTDTSPWPEGVPFPSGATLYDLIYNPPITHLRRDAADAGVRTIGGLGMLVRQAALSFEYWTGIRPPLDVMEQAARDTLRMRHDA